MEGDSVKNKDLMEYYKIVSPILKHPDFQLRKTFDHHENESVFMHSLKVSLLSYKIAKKLNKDYKTAAIGGLLHDFYEEPWQIKGKLVASKDKNFFKGHGFTHAKSALDNSNNTFVFHMNKKIENIIKRHMFPLNVIPPLYIESWIVTMADKYISLAVFKNPKELPKYLGIKKRGV